MYELLHLMTIEVGGKGMRKLKGVGSGVGGVGTQLSGNESNVLHSTSESSLLHIIFPIIRCASGMR